MHEYKLGIVPRYENSIHLLSDDLFVQKVKTFDQGKRRSTVFTFREKLKEDIPNFFCFEFSMAYYYFFEDTKI